MPRITNWRRESRSPTLAYRNTETGVQAVLHRAPDSYRYKWRGAILVDGYPVWSRGTRRKTRRRSVTSSEGPARTSAVRGPNEDVRVGEKAADGANVQRWWYDCPDCGYEAPSRIVYGAER